MLNPFLTAMLVLTSSSTLADNNSAKLFNQNSTKIIKNQYIVVFNTPAGITSRAAVRSHVTNSAELLTQRYQVKVKSSFGDVLNAVLVTAEPDQLKQLLKDGNVRYIEQDQYVSLDPLVSITGLQPNASWGLDRIDQRDLPLNNHYQYRYDGSNTTAYILDTGIRNTHQEFGGRASSGYDFIDNDTDASDCNGHGTHVAGTIGANTWGVAKNIRLVGVRVLNCQGSGSYSGIIAGVNWVVDHASGPAVANMSLGGSNSPALTEAITNAVNRGVTFVVAAGNQAGNACQYSPANTPAAITVGATTNLDSRSDFSNHGNCLDLFAPGSNITSTWHQSDNSQHTISGTSMAAPHVAGVVGLLLNQQPGLTPAQISATLVAASTKNKITDVRNGSPNQLLYAFNDSAFPPTLTKWLAAFGAINGGWSIDRHPRLLADVNGDHKQDIVGFADNGVMVSLSFGSGFYSPAYWLANYGYVTGGWSVDRHPRLLADVNGDGKDDVVGFSDTGTMVALSTGQSFAPATNWLNQYGFVTGGWRIDRHPRLMADVNGDNKADVVGFADDGVLVAVSQGASFQPASFWAYNYGYVAGGWRDDKHLRMMADVNADGKDDVVGFADDGVLVALSSGSSFTQPAIWSHSFGYLAGSWRIDKHPRFLADLNGDQKADVVGFSDAGVIVALSTGTGFSEPALWLNQFGYIAGGWRVDKHPRILSDVNGDGKTDIVGFADDGTYVAYSTGNGFTPLFRLNQYFGFGAGGWRVGTHPRFVNDINGDGKADLVGFADDGVYVQPQ